METAGVRLVAEGAAQFQSDMDGAGRSVSGFGAILGDAGGMLGGLATAAAGVAVVAGGAVVAGLSAAAGAGLSFNNAVEQASAKINAFTKDSAATAEILEMVRQRAANTPFAFEEMANAAAGLGPAARSAGVPLEDLLETAEILAASNPAEGLEGAAFALREAAGGDFTSVIERFNLSRQTIQALKDEGVPNLEIVSRALQEAGYDYDLVSALAATASGRFSTFQDTFVNLAGTVTQPIFDAFSAGLGTVNEILTANAPLLERVAAQLGTALAPAAQWLGEAMANAATGFVGFVDLLVNADGSLRSFGEIMAGFVASLGLAYPALQPLMDGLAEVTGFLQANWQPILAAAAGVLAVALVPAIAGAVAAFAGAVAAAAPVLAVLAVVGTAAAALQGVWATNFGGIQQATAEAMSAIQNVISSVLGVITTFWNQHGAEIMAFAQKAWTQIQQIVGTATAIVLQIVTSVLNTVSGFINTHGADIQAVLTTAWNTIQTVISTVLSVIQGVLNTVMAVIQGDWQTAWNEIQTIVSTIINAVQSIISDVLSTIQSIWANNQDAILAKAREIWDGVKAKVQEIVDSLPGMAAQFVSAAMSLGSSIISGITQGIQAGIASVTEAAREIAEAALAAAQSALGISSPSRVMADQVGVPMAEGVAQGILAAIGAATNAAEELSDAILRTLTDMASQAQQILDDVFAAQIGLSRGSMSITRGVMEAELASGRAADELNKKNIAYGEAVAAQQAEQAKSAAAIAAIQAKQRKADQDTAAKRAKLEQDRALAAVTAAQNLDPAQRRKALERMAAIDASLGELRLDQAAALRETEAAIANERQRTATAQQRLAERTAHAQREQEVAARAYNTHLDRARLQKELLGQAQAEADRIAASDPVAARAYLQLRLRQIDELISLQAEADNETRAGTRQLLEQQLLLLKQAQAQELAQFQTQQERRAAEMAAIADDAAATGNAMVDGIIAAIRASTAGLTSALTGALQQAVAAARASLGIRSPSSVLAAAVGAPMAEGVGAGFADALPGVTRAMQRGSQAMVASIARPVANSATTVTYGDTSVSINGAGMSEAQLERVVTRVLDRRTNRADAMRRTG